MKPTPPGGDGGLWWVRELIHSVSKVVPFRFQGLVQDEIRNVLIILVLANGGTVETLKIISFIVAAKLLGDCSLFFFRVESLDAAVFVGTIVQRAGHVHGSLICFTTYLQFSTSYVSRQQRTTSRLFPVFHGFFREPPFAFKPSGNHSV